MKYVLYVGNKSDVQSNAPVHADGTPMVRGSFWDNDGGSKDAVI